SRDMAMSELLVRAVDAFIKAISSGRLGQGEVPDWNAVCICLG
ncbi:unnamed protein product, partial [Allacma fusca]